MMATMRDVARHAGVAPSTVSYMLSGDKPVAAATRERIEQAMDALGYRPNAIARSLASRRTRILALHLPEFDVSAGETVFEIVRGAYDRAAERGYLLTVWPIAAERAPQELSELVGRGHADAVLLVEVELDDPRVDSLHSSGIPFPRRPHPASSALHFVDIDFEATIDQALEALTTTGHRDDAPGPFARWNRGIRPGRALPRGLRPPRRAGSPREHAWTPPAGRPRSCAHGSPARTGPAQTDRRPDSGRHERPRRRRLRQRAAGHGVRSAPGPVHPQRRLEPAHRPLTALAHRLAGAGRDGRRVDALLDQLADPHAPPTQVLVACTRYDGDSLGTTRRRLTPPDHPPPHHPQLTGKKHP